MKFLKKKRKREFGFVSVCGLIGKKEYEGGSGFFLILFNFKIFIYFVVFIGLFNYCALAAANMNI